MRPSTKIAILDNCKMDAIKKNSYDVKLLNSNYHVMETLSIRVAHKKVGTLCKNQLPL